MKYLQHKLTKFLLLGLFVLTNLVIIFESSLPANISSQRSNFFTNIASLIINGVLPDKEPEIVAVTDIEITNNVEQIVTNGDTYDIPLGVTRRFSAAVFPNTATSKTIKWHSERPETLRVTSGGYLEARALDNNVKVTVSSSNQEVSKYFYINIVNKSAPLDFETVLENDTLKVGTSTKLKILLSERERREFDPSLLFFTSSNPHIASVNNFGVINALSVGETVISIKNHAQTYQVNVLPNSEPIIKANSLTLSGPTSAYVYSYAQLSATFDQLDATDQSITYMSLNEAIATVDETGLVFGAKVAGTTTIRAYANADFAIYDDFVITMEEVLPTSLTLTTSKSEVDVGAKLNITPTLFHDINIENLPVTNQEIIYTSSDENIATVTSSSGVGVVLGKKRGSVVITATSEANIEVQATLTLTIIPLEAINNSNIASFGAYLRKALGHFSLFFVNGLLGALTFYLFIDKKSLAVKLLLSLIPGIFFAALSEFIQLFVDGRGASIYDVLIDSSGYIAAVLCVYLFFVVKQKIKQKKDSKNELTV